MLNRSTRNLTSKMQFFRHHATSEKIYPARPRIKHYVVSRDEKSDYRSILKEIMDIVSANKDSIFFLTQKSRVVVTSHFDPIRPGRPASKEEIKKSIFSQSFKRALDNQEIIPLFRPEPGHVCLTLTDKFGNVEESNTVSLRPHKRRIAVGRADLYPTLYGNMSGAIYQSQHTHFHFEAEKLAKTVAHQNSTTVADITIVPFSSSELTREQLIKNISKAKTAPIYNLCKAAFKEKILQGNDDISIELCLNEMKQVINSLKLKNPFMPESDEVMLAAFACTNAAVEVCFGDPHFLAKEVLLDLSTQTTVTLCCAMSLVGEREFFQFAKNLGFYDDNIELLEGLRSDKIMKP